RGQAAAHRGPQDPHQPEQPEHRGGAGQQHRRAVGEAAAEVQAVGDGAHRVPSRFARPRSISRAIDSTMKVTTNSRKPSAIRELRYIGESASANSFAIVAAIELPGSSSDAVRKCALPSTKVTAIVSPSARPRPMKMPPRTAERVYGSTMFQTTSVVVE